MSADVPLDDLPANLVPAGDLPGAPDIKPRIDPSTIVEPDAGQRRMGIRKNRIKDNSTLLKAGKGFLNLGEDVGRETSATLADYGLSPGAANMGGFLADAGTYFLPVAGSGQALKAVVKPLAETGAAKLMWSALKPGKAARESGDAAKAVRTLLDEGVNVTEGGVKTLTDKIDKLDDALSAAIQGSSATLQKSDVLMSLRDVIREYKQGTLTSGNLDKIRDVGRELMNHPLLRGVADIPVQLAQTMKRANYRELGDKAFGIGLRPSAERDALKAVTRSLKEGVEAGVPEAAAINAEMSPLINARDMALDRVLVSMNKQPLGIGILNPATLIAHLADRSELFKSILARSLNSGALPGTVGQGLGGVLEAGQIANRE